MKQLVTLAACFAVFVSHSYGQTKNSDSLSRKYYSIPTNASVLEEKDLNKSVAFTPMQLIAGKVPGLVVQCSNTNDPNPVIEYKLRGSSTMVLSTSLLYVVDGIPLDNIDFVIPENIESIQVLKNISETAQYGIRGCNGVVLITTKPGSSKPFSLSYSTFAYSEQYAHKSEYMNANEYSNLVNEWSRGSDLTKKSFTTYRKDYHSSTDWRDAISQQKISQSHALNASGTIKNTSYVAAGSFNDYSGILQKTGSEDYKGQFSISQKAFRNKLEVAFTYMGNSRKYSAINNSLLTNSYGVESSSFLTRSLLSYAEKYNPTIPIYNTNGSYGSDTTTSYYNENPVKRLNNITDNRKFTSNNYTFRASYKIIDGLTLSAAYSKNSHRNKIESTYIYEAYKGEIANRIINSSDSFSSTYKYAGIAYAKTIQKHTFDIRLDYSELKTNDKNRSIDSTHYRDNYSCSGSNSELWTEQKQYLLKAGYNYNQIYYCSLSLLNENSPLYSYKTKDKYYPSINLAWEIANEDVFRSIQWLDRLTLRGGYGESNRSLAKKESTALYNNTSSYLYTPNFHSERLYETNIGANIGVLNKRLNVAIDFYNLETKDGAVTITMPSGTSFYSNYITNALELVNKGVEINVTAIPLLNPVKWSVSGNISFNKNSLNYKDIDIKSGSAGDFQGFRFAGFTVDHEMLFKQPGSDESTTNYPTYEKIGNGIPKSYFGLSNQLTYKQFDFNISLRGAAGFDIRDYTKLDLYSRNIKKDNLQYINENYYDYGSLYDADFIVEKGDYVKVDNISLGYTFNLEKQHINSLNIYVACNNVATFTNFKGGDPEAVSLSNNNQGIYYCSTYPNTRLFILGLKLTL